MFLKSISFQMSCFFIICENQVHRMRQAFLYRILTQEMEWFDENEVGKLTQKMSAGIDGIRNGTSDKLAVVIQASVGLVAGLIAAFVMSWRMALIMLAIIPFVLVNVIVSSFVSFLLKG